MVRERTPLWLMMYGVYLYFASRSLRLASRSLEPIVGRSHVALWKWIQRFAYLADRFGVDRCAVKHIFVDETLIRVKGREYWLWIAYEPSLDRCLLMHLSVERTLLVCYMFLKRVRARYGRKSVLTDGALWYPDACRWLRLPHAVYPVQEKNLMERFIQHVKDRTECFDDHFPCRKEECDMMHVWNWLKLFILHIHLNLSLPRLISFLRREVTLS
ncbi:MAG: DDE-type integrase/transposase/recombinase [Nitrososphaerales archaeon]